MFRVDSALSRVVLVALAAALAPACSAEDEEGTQGEPSGGSGAPTAASEFTCADDDLESSPFGGSGFKDGALTGAAQDAYLASSTLLSLKADEASQRRFGEVMAPIISQLPAQEGLIGFALGTSAKCGYARTVTVWKDEEAMGKFVLSDAHRAAMSVGSDVSVHGAVTHWTVGAGDLPLSWEAAREKIAAAEISY